MTPNDKFALTLKWAGALFLGALLLWGGSFSLIVLFFGPLGRWAIHGTLDFSITISALLNLGYVIVAMSFFTTIVMWLAGRWKGRW